MGDQEIIEGSAKIADLFGKSTEFLIGVIVGQLEASADLRKKLAKARDWIERHAHYNVCDFYIDRQTKDCSCGREEILEEINDSPTGETS